MKCRLSVLFLLICIRSFPQAQTCPVNINFVTGDLTHWFAYTGNNMNGYGAGALIQDYDSTLVAPRGTIGNSSIIEYLLPSYQGIRILTTSYTDPFGLFPTVPIINGYNYKYSILLGSTAITQGNGFSGSGGGYIRGVSYNIRVPPGPATKPYTMTYAYAMVLENGTHVSNYQPVISAKLQTPDGIITCASPRYYLPTFNNVSESGRGATLDSAQAKANGFSVSRTPSPNTNLDPNGNSANLQDVWTKDWTEVTFDLSPYRGQNVSLTFEADNCVPGGHFAYAYIAIRNSCAGLEISGDSLVCFNTIVTYSVPALAGATYDWIVPNTWTLASSDTGNIIKVKPIAAGGLLSVREKNSCANLTDTIQIKTLPGPKGGDLDGSSTVCIGENSSLLNLVNYSGTVNNWLSSTDSTTWSIIPVLSAQYIAANLNSKTMFKVVVGKGTVCPPDTSSVATIAVDQKTVGGLITPPDAVLCAGQDAGETLFLTGYTGSVQNWQYSTDGTNWSDYTPVNSTPANTVSDITVTTQYRLIDKNGVCPTDTSSVASITFNPVAFPKATTAPADTTICFGAMALLKADIDIGTNYTWNPVSAGAGSIGSTPLNFIKQVSPDSTQDYVLRIVNSGCPNPLLDTFHVIVLAPVIVNAGRDTSVVVGQSMQFDAYSSDPGPDGFLWTPATELNDPSIYNPVAIYTVNDDVIKYMVKATTAFGCTGTGYITVKVYKTKPDIFVPNAFTPGTAVNSIFRPVAVGISSLQYFRIYNRLGQLVYNTATLGNGWDGLLNGLPQPLGGYVWMVQGTDYRGTVVTKKGTMVLVR
jgi:PKD-like domain/CHU_C Type IX secretion signal domain